jgi:RHS repeat-associated protein
VVGTETEGFNGLIYSNTKYDSKGQVVASLSPHYKGGNAILTSTSYDRHGRVIETNVNNVETAYSYSTLKSTTHSPNGTFTKTTNSAGDVLVSTDPGGTIYYKYHSSGQPREITSNGSTVIIAYNALGQKESLSDPDAGMINYQYTGFGESKTQTDANGNVTSIIYDKAGRIDKKTCGSLVSDYEYYDSGKKIGLLEYVNSSNNTRTDYDYNEFGQLTVEKENIQGKIFQTSYSYDSYNRVNSIAYPSGFAVTQHYNNGYLSEVKRADNGKSIWKIGSVEANGQVKSFVSGNGKWTHKTLNNDGYLTSIKSDYGRIQNLSYKFDKEKGNLLERRDVRAGRIETFTYDNLNRLRTSKIGTQTQYYNYDNNGKGNGNISYKTHVGTYEYDKLDKGPHAVSGISNVDGLIKSIQNIDYTSFNKVNQITQASYRMNFVYGHDFARRKSELFKDNSKVMTKYFVGNYEQKDIGSKSYKISYIMGGDGLAAMHIIGSNGPDMLYVHKDHLGSIQTLSCDDVSRNYGIIDEFAYDAWGKRIYTDEPGFNNDLTYQDLCRGYTGHEHLHEFGLINMNGRVYDPLLGRFLSPDNYVQLPFFTQNYNRFAYCLNNPLIYTDPSGQSIVGDAFKWIKKNIWDAAWDGLNNFAQWADQNGIPAAGGGYNSAHGTYHYMGNSGNVYHNQFGNNYEGKVEQAVYTARQEIANTNTSSIGNNLSYLNSNSNGGTGAFSLGFTLSFSTPFKGPLGGGWGISMGRFQGLTTRGIYLTTMKGRGVSLTASLDATYYKSLTGNIVTLNDLPGYGSQIDFGAAFVGYSLGSNAYYKDGYKPISPTYRSHSLSLSEGMDIGHSKYETKTYALPIPPWIGLLLPVIPKF